MSLRFIAGAMLVGLALASGASAQNPPPPSPGARAAWGFDRSDLPPDPHIRFGVLANGMRYAILRNERPGGAVAIRMRVAVGTTAGAPGEAHFLEHMAFMGSGHMPEGALARLTGREHLRLGRDFNASTGYFDTLYRIDLPHGGRERTERTIMLMREMASELSLTPAGIEQARPAVIEEARQRSGPEDLAERDQVLFFIPGTAIARSLEAGSEREAAGISPEGLRRLYDRYYSPERVILIVVGDVDPGWIEARIQAHFGDWRARAPIADPPPDPIDPARATGFRAFAAPRLSTRVTVASVTPLAGGGDATAPRDRDFLQSLAADMLAARITGYRGADRPFMDAEAVTQDYFGVARISYLRVRSIDGDWQAALAVAEQTLRGALEHGFTQAELDAHLAFEAERMAGLAAPATSAALADRIAALAAAGIVVTAPGRPDGNAAYLARVRLDEVNAALRASWAAPGRLIHVAHDRPIEGGEARLAQVWRASAAVVSH